MPFTPFVLNTQFSSRFSLSPKSIPLSMVLLVFYFVNYLPPFTIPLLSPSPREIWLLLLLLLYQRLISPVRLKHTELSFNILTHLKSASKT
jgi:hypothetical protein